ncbi:MAG: hypothetical protein PVJ27_06030, partial [Candidatus Brocadiaceae bacterium]
MREQRVDRTGCEFDLTDALPERLRRLTDPRAEIPGIAKDPDTVRAIEASVQRVPTTHRLHLADARHMELARESIHLVLTSPPYWTLKEYPEEKGQLGLIEDYE